MHLRRGCSTPLVPRVFDGLGNKKLISFAEPAKLGGAGMLAFFATFDQKMNEYPSQSPIISSPDSWWSNINPVNYLVENAALAEAFVAADAADREAKKREEEERKKQGGN